MVFHPSNDAYVPFHLGRPVYPSHLANYGYASLEIERALLYKDAITMFVATSPKDAKLQALDPADWEAIELVEEWLRLFREATTLMSSTSGMTLSTVHATFRELQDHVRDAFASMPISAPPSLKTGLLNAHTKLSDYYLIFDSSPYYVWAACGYPPSHFPV